MKGQGRVDEFAFVLLAGIILIMIMMVVWSTTVPAITLVPEFKSLSIPKGSRSSFILTIKGNSEKVTLKAIGTIKDWITFDKNNFDVSGSTTVKIIIEVPYGAEERKVPYEGSIDVSVKEGGKKTVRLSITVLSEAEYVKTAEDVEYPIPLRDFEVVGLPASETLDSEYDVEVVRGYFTDYPLILTGELTDKKISMAVGGQLHLTIRQTNNAGNILAFFNDKEILNGRPGQGDVYSPIDKSLLKGSNTLTIKAEPPGWKFWMNTVYRIDAELLINYQQAQSATEFYLGSKEVNNFRFGKLEFNVKNQTDPKSAMKIEINDYVIFNKIPSSTFYEDFGTEVPLYVGKNSISFSVEKEGSYYLEDVTLTIVYRD